MIVGLKTYRSADWKNPYTSTFTNYNQSSLKNYLHGSSFTGIDLLRKQMHAPEWDEFVAVDVPAQLITWSADLNKINGWNYAALSASPALVCSTVKLNQILDDDIKAALIPSVTTAVELCNALSA